MLTALAHATCKPVPGNDGNNTMNDIVIAKHQLEAVIDRLPQLICLLDRDGRILRANRTIERWGICGVAEVRGRRAHEVLHPDCDDDGCALGKILDRIVAAGEERGQEAEECFDARLLRHLSLQATLMGIGGKGKPHGGRTLLVIDDISEQKEFAHKAAVSEERLQALVHYASDTIMRLSVDGHILYASPAVRRMFGYEPAAIKGRAILELVHEQDVEHVSAVLEQLQQLDHVDTSTYRLKNSGGKYVWVETKCQSVMGADKRHPLEIIAVVRDATERRREQERADAYRDQLEDAVARKTRQLRVVIEKLKKQIAVHEHYLEALETSERRYNALVENTLTGIYVRENDVIQFCNERFADIFGYSRADVEGMEVGQLFQDQEPPDDLLENGSGNGNSMHGSRLVEGVTRSGDRVWLRSSIARFPCQERSLAIGNVIDVTAQVAMLEVLRRSEANLRRLSSQLLSAQENERKRIAAELHDSIGQRMSAIKFAVEDALRTGHDGMSGETVVRLSTVVDHIRDTIDEVRRTSMELRPPMLDDLGLLPTIDWFCREYGGVFDRTRVDKRIGVSEREVPQELKIVVFRIIQEAFHNITKHAGATAILLQLAADNGRLQLTVQDNGCGFDMEDVGRSGSGMGLTSMRERAELSGGVFRLASTPEGGTAITASWPASAAGSG